MSLVATAVVALLVARVAWPAGRVTAAALACAWLASVPVLDWAIAVKPDLLAVALAASAVVALGGRRALLAGALLALAALAKPTALLPALALVGWLVVARDGRSLLRLAAGAVGIALAAAPLIASLGPADLWRHVVSWNALPWDAGRAVLLLMVGALLIGAHVALGARSARGPYAAYLAGATGIALLGGREGATINYLLDLAAASALALAARPPAMSLAGAALAAQLAVGVLALDPFGLVPWTAPATGHWGSVERVAAVRAAAALGEILAEDAGLALAAGRTPVVDDLFLWSRLVSVGALDPEPLLARVRRGDFGLVVAEADLAALGRAPDYERARWHPGLAAAVRERYGAGEARAGLRLYRLP